MHENITCGRRSSIGTLIAVIYSHYHYHYYFHCHYYCCFYFYYDKYQCDYYSNYYYYSLSLPFGVTPSQLENCRAPNVGMSETHGLWCCTGFQLVKKRQPYLFHTCRWSMRNLCLHSGILGRSNFGPLMLINTEVNRGKSVQRLRGIWHDPCLRLGTDNLQLSSDDILQSLIVVSTDDTGVL